MDDHWRDTVEVRGIDVWDSISYPANAPLTMRPRLAQGCAPTPIRPVGRAGDARPASASRTPSAIACFRSRPFATRTWQPPSPGRSTTGWRASGWTRTRASGPPSCCPSNRPSASVEEIERRPADQRFVQVLMLAMGEHPLGKSMLLADLRRRRTPRLHRRHPCRQQLPPRHYRLGLAHLLSRGLCRAVARAFTPSSAA